MLTGAIERDRDQSARGEFAWYSIYCRSRHEKRVHDELSARRINSFLPLRTITRFWSDRRKTIQEPVFRSYVFVEIALGDRSRVLETPGVVSFVGSGGGAWPVSRREIEALQRFVQEDLVIDPYPYLSEGRSVRVKRGPLTGIEGFIVHKRGATRLVLSVEMMQQSVAVEIDPALVEPV